jgi:beta-xylosidase
VLRRQRGVELWWDRGEPPGRRVAALLTAMTVDEKVAQLGALWTNETATDARRLAAGGIGTDELGAAVPHGIGHLTRPIGAAPDAAAGAQLVDDVQRWLAEHTRLGVPALVHEECLTGLMVNGAVVTPSPLNIGATFDASTARSVGELIGRQCSAAGVHVGLGPVLDVPLDQRWGRVEECFAEDGWLTAACGAGYIEGLQSAGVAAMAKHFVGHGASVGGRNCAPAMLGPRQLVERHLLAFEAAIAAGVEMVMAAYHDIDGVPVCAEPRLLTTMLRDQLGFDGVVVSDYWAIDWLHEEHRISVDRADSAAVALRAGVDVELPRLRCYRHLPELVQRGRVPMSVLDRAVRRVLALKVRLGLLDEAVAVHRPVVNRSRHVEVCRQVAAAGITLVENDGVLPLRPASRILLCGPNAHAGAQLWQLLLAESPRLPARRAIVAPECRQPAGAAPQRSRHRPPRLQPRRCCRRRPADPGGRHSSGRSRRCRGGGR